MTDPQNHPERPQENRAISDTLKTLKEPRIAEIIRPKNWMNVEHDDDGHLRGGN